MAEKKPKKEKELEKVEPTKDEQKDVKLIERIIESREIAPHDAFGKLNRAQVELIKRTIAKGATDDELKLFISVCHGLQLSPFSKQVHLVGRWDSKAGKEVKQIQVGIDGFRATAEKTGKYAGNDDAIFDGEQVVEYVMGEKKEKKTITAPQKATVTVYKIVEGVRYPFTATARWSEYYPGGKMGFQWHVRPFLMLGKCAEALALRKAFPALLSGIYVPEEMERGQEENTDAEKNQANFKNLVSSISKMTAEQLKEYKQKMDKSDKYTKEQKDEFVKLANLRIAELSKPKEGEIPIIQEGEFKEKQ